MFFFSVPTEKKQPKRELAVSVAFPSRYRSHIRAKVEGAHSKVKAPSPLERAGERLLNPKPPLCILRLSSRLGIVQASLTLLSQLR